MKKAHPVKMAKRHCKVVPKPVRIAVNNQINGQRYSSPYAHPQVELRSEAVSDEHATAKPSRCSKDRSHPGAARTRKPQAFHDTRAAVSGLHCTPLLTEAEAAAILRVRSKTLAAWRYKKRYDLAYIKVGRLVRYRLEDIEAFIESRRQQW
jgi:hypothetical protein